MLGLSEILLSKLGYFLTNSSYLHNNSGRGLEKVAHDREDNGS